MSLLITLYRLVPLQVRTQFRKIFTQMGFEEMPTANYVESSFWNFDALFQPQQHPARDAHDTFFLTNPAKTVGNVPEDYLQRVKVRQTPLQHRPALLKCTHGRVMPLLATAFRQIWMNDI